MVNVGIPIEVCGVKRHIRAKSGGYEELILMEASKILASAEGLNFGDLVGGQFTWTELATLIEKIGRQCSGSTIRIVQLIFQTTEKPPEMDPNVEWDLSEEDVRWGIDAPQRAQILEVFFQLQWSWVKRLKNLVGQVMGTKTETPEEQN